MAIIIRVLGSDDTAVLEQVAVDVFDNEVDPRWSTEFLADPRHHLAVALDDGQAVGMASAVHYVHPTSRRNCGSTRLRWLQAIVTGALAASYWTRYSPGGEPWVARRRGC